VLPWLKREFPSITKAEVALDLACNCGISAVALATSLPQLMQITAIDRSPAALAVGEYLTGNQPSLAGASPAAFMGFEEALRKSRQEWCTELDQRAKIAFEWGDVCDLSRFSNSSFDLVYFAMGWHWAVKSGAPDSALAEIYRVMKPGAVFATYVFGLADEFARRHCPDGRYLTESPILRGMYEELESTTGVAGLANAVSTDPPSVFPAVSGGSGLHDYFASRLSQYNEKFVAIKYQPLLVETAPPLLVEMAETQTAGHVQHFITGRSDLSANMHRFAKSRGEGVEQALISATAASFRHYKDSGLLAQSIEQHQELGRFYEVLPALAFQKKG
jgi:ubiquinone/menaquinone biosynthesis C-methylase UbiE